jgi:hypothetical protein
MILYYRIDNNKDPLVYLSTADSWQLAPRLGLQQCMTYDPPLDTRIARPFFQTYALHLASAKLIFPSQPYASCACTYATIIMVYT